MGTREITASPPSGLREAIARCSLEYFIADKNSPANEQLQGEIGKDATLLTTAEIEDIITESWKE